MINSLNIGITGLKAAQMGMDVTSHNVANVHTDGFRREVVQLTESARTPTTATDFGGQGVGFASVSNAGDPFIDQLMNEYATKLGKNQEALDALKSLNSLLKNNDVMMSSMDVLNAFQDVSNDPTNIPVRENLLQKLESFKEVTKSLNGSLTEFNQYVTNKSQATIDNTNDLLQNIADLGKLASNISDTSSLSSKRNSLLTQLASKMQYTVLANGDIVGENNRPLITGTTVNKLTYADIPNIKEGVIGGLSIVGDMVSQIQTQLPTSIKFFADQVNTIHKQGFDLNGNAGGAVFNNFTTISDLAITVTSPSDVAASTDKNNKIINGNTTQNISDLRYSLFGNQSIFEKITELQRKSSGLENQFKNTADAAASLYDQLKNSNLSNVNLDEEAANLIKYQKMYEANSKIIQISNSMLGTILDIIA